MEHEFTPQIKRILATEFGKDADIVYEKSPLLQYLNIKTQSASRGSKARGSFANLYAVYVLVEDYLKNGYDKRRNYSDYAGAKFTDLLRRQLKQKLRERAEKQYSVKAVVERYMACIEEIINLTVLQERFKEAVALGYLRDILDEIMLQSRVEFNYEDDAT